jgi:hypothetical protein
MEYLIYNVLLFGSIYALCKAFEWAVWQVIENYDMLQGNDNGRVE